MTDPDNSGEAEIRRVVRDEMPRAAWSVLSTVFWTILAVFAVLVGLQAVQLAFYTTGLAAAVTFITVGILVTCASIYLIYNLHWA